MAAAMLGVRRNEWDDRSVDHRTLQVAHDLLAAVWRFRADPQQMDAFAAVASIDDWLPWLGREVAGWRQHPILVHQMRLVVEHGNALTGQAAEAALAWHLLDSYDDVPWRTDWRDAIWAGYQRTT
ncbi:hypothetical protein [uncultured Sphingomonas sp.]|uniref:hypothetical protein n=1 Tax=uncultured Sphingomonas sp. TaxID=158754 RepID=UPI0035CA74DD